jgi:hypothetical protein
MQNVVARKCGKMITHYFLFKKLFLDEEIWHCCHGFQFWFWRWNVFFCSIMCTWEKMWLKDIWNKNLAKISTLCKLQMIKHSCFSTFLEVPSFVPLSSNVIFRSDFSTCTMYLAYLFAIMGVGTKCMSPRKCSSSRSR